jgi:hypothetical protein
MFSERDVMLAERQRDRIVPSVSKHCSFSQSAHVDCSYRISRDREGTDNVITVDIEV